MNTFNKKPVIFEQAASILRNLKYTIHDLIFPWNVIKVKNLPRSWRDRDEVLFHAMFTIFVDFIEQEQRLVPWDQRYKRKVFDDFGAMVKFVEDEYGPNGSHDNKEYADHMYPIYKEWLWMYKWYKDRHWDESEIVWESLEEEQAQLKRCDDKLHRIIAWRHYYWT